MMDNVELLEATILVCKSENSEKIPPWEILKVKRLCIETWRKLSMGNEAQVETQQNQILPKVQNTVCSATQWNSIISVKLQRK